jgi:hypothetical protein
MSKVWLKKPSHVPRDLDEWAYSVYRCLKCEGIYNLYSGTLFEKKHLRPSQVILLLRGAALKGSRA